MDRIGFTRVRGTRRRIRLPLVATITVATALAAGEGSAVAGSGSSQSLAPWSWDLVGPLLIVAALLAILGLIFRRGGH
jgi:hypothetical protein